MVFVIMGILRVNKRNLTIGIVKVFIGYVRRLWNEYKSNKKTKQNLYVFNSQIIIYFNETLKKKKSWKLFQLCNQL